MGRGRCLKPKTGRFLATSWPSRSKPGDPKLDPHTREQPSGATAGDMAPESSAAASSFTSFVCCTPRLKHSSSGNSRRDRSGSVLRFIKCLWMSADVNFVPDAVTAAAKSFASSASWEDKSAREPNHEFRTLSDHCGPRLRHLSNLVCRRIMTDELPITPDTKAHAHVMCPSGSDHTQWDPRHTCDIQLSYNSKLLHLT